MTGRMLCSGTGGPPSAAFALLTCPVCQRSFPDRPWLPFVPRHFIPAGGT